MPLLVELGERTWTGQLERVEPWLATTVVSQGAFRRMLEDTAYEVGEPHIRKWLGDMLDAAREHERLIDELYVAFRLDPARRPALGGASAALLAKAREIGAHVEGLAGGLRGGAWRKLRELTLANLDSTTAFGIVEQLGLALGIPLVVDLVVPVVGRKSQHQLVLRECLLEMAPKAILYGA
ncbi:hypothetical protein HC031_02110 [Planosporangium thailandense]|uniref:Uncharacterized protein n=1 Tax=Planosporangium thailandense TaxID=765197 RepID=A0ABX0XR96_9ACTN|nr:hypothetical protein [Planosporangium thailandense]NJC68522.1 hypothetical protein [Planosporangium thailandense]